MPDPNLLVTFVLHGWCQQVEKTNEKSAKVSKDGLHFHKMTITFMSYYKKAGMNKRKMQ